MKTNRHDTGQSDAERRKLALMRQADSGASTKYNIGDVEKTRGPKQKPVTLASTAELSKFDDDE
jgi:hypothetical protein